LAVRTYHSERRTERAAATRAAVVASAAALFLERGFATTTIRDVARRAGVSQATVELLFGSKRKLLDTVAATSVRGGEVPLVESDAWTEMLQCADPHELVHALARIMRGVFERGADALEVMRLAAAADPEVLESVRAGEQHRRQDLATVVRRLRRLRSLRGGLKVTEALDILCALTDHGLYRSLVVRSGWTSRRYEAWMAWTLEGSLLRRAA
jgi:AcrR family transcriptional regulator